MKKLFLTITLLICFSSFGQTAKEYSNKGVDKFLSGDYSGSITEYNKAIEINPNNSDIYYNRGASKSKLKNYKGAIIDYTKAIEINPNYGRAYGNRGIAKENIGDLKGACSDWKKAIELGVTGAAEWVKNQCN